MAFSLSETTILSAIKGGNLISILSSVLKPGYSITFNTLPAINDPLNGKGNIGGAVFMPTSFISVEQIGEASVTSAPIEQGGYTSFNKVIRPRQLMVVFTLEGWTGYSGAIPNLTNLSTLSVEKLLSTLETMRTSTYTYTIETPDTTYSSFDLVRFSYAKTSGAGVTLLKVSAMFQEVLQVAETSISTSSTANRNSSIDAAMCTVSTSSSTTDATLDDVRNAWSNGNASLSEALTTTADYATSEITSAASTVATSWEKASTAVSSQIKTGVSSLLKVVT